MRNGDKTEVNCSMSIMSNCNCSILQTVIAILWEELSWYWVCMHLFLNDSLNTCQVCGHHLVSGLMAAPRGMILEVWGGTVQIPWLLLEPAASSAQQTAQLHSTQGWDSSCRWSVMAGDTSAPGTRSDERSLFCAEQHCASPGPRSPRSSAPVVTTWSQRVQGTSQCPWDGREVSLQGNW